jgi:poly-gamma-glutamate synthesis protein (capsule biosynthesis protein)
VPTLFVCGDVMTGRGIDQALPYPCDPVLHEPYVKDARDYVDLAERAHGPIARPLAFPHIWGDALAELDRQRPEVRLINLETSVTTSTDAWPGKGIHYRMNPRNAPCLTAARIGCCALANNHVLDWGYSGLAETLATLKRAGIAAAGAGADLAEASAPAALRLPGGARVLVFSAGLATSGVFTEWAAAGGRPGVWLLPARPTAAVAEVRERVESARRDGDIVVVSLHWGGNWGHRVPASERELAYGLVEQARVDLVHGHSSHHPKAIEVYRGKLILYGCGDLLTDYEGISGYEEFRGELSCLYFAHLEASGKLAELTMAPTCMRRLRVNRASDADARWLADSLDRQCRSFGTRVERRADGSLALRWREP